MGKAAADEAAGQSGGDAVIPTSHAIVRTKRTCLRCRRQFLSCDQVRNRLCFRCNNINRGPDVKYSERVVREMPEERRDVKRMTA